MRPNPNDDRLTECEVRAVGARLRELRSQAGLTQAALACEIGTTQSSVARMEGGRSRTSLESIRRVASVLGCNVAVVIEHRKSA